MLTKEGSLYWLSPASPICGRSWALGLSLPVAWPGFPRACDMCPDRVGWAEDGLFCLPLHCRTYRPPSAC
jgi:hypothetical protein